MARAFHLFVYFHFFSMKANIGTKIKIGQKQIFVEANQHVGGKGLFLFMWCA